MTKIPRISFALLTIVAFATFCEPARLSAMGFPRFDAMSAEAQAEFIAVMVDDTEKALGAGGHAELAAQVETLFTTVEPGDEISLGLVETERNVDRGRVFDAERVAKDPKARRLEVEDTLFVTLKKNNIELTDGEFQAVLDSLANFHQQTYAEFASHTVAERRRFVALMAKLAFPDLEFRQEVEALSKRAGKADPIDTARSKENAQMMREVIDDKFPVHMVNQPGFDEVARNIAVEGAKDPNAPVTFFEVGLYVFDQAEARIRAQKKKMDDETYHLPR